MRIGLNHTRPWDFNALGVRLGRYHTRFEGLGAISVRLGQYRTRPTGDGAMDLGTAAAHCEARQLAAAEKL